MRTLRGLVSRRYTIAFVPKALTLSAAVSIGRDGRTSQFGWTLGIQRPGSQMTSGGRRLKRCPMPRILSPSTS